MKEPRECRLFMKGKFMASCQAYSKRDVVIFMDKQKKLQPPIKHNLMCFEVPSFLNHNRRK